MITNALLRRVTSVNPVNLAFGTRTTLREVISELERILERSLEIEHELPRPGDVRDSQADNLALKGLFPDVLAMPLRAGLEATVRWLADRSGTAALARHAGLQTGLS